MAGATDVEPAARAAGRRQFQRRVHQRAGQPLDLTNAVVDGAAGDAQRLGHLDLRHAVDEVHDGDAHRGLVALIQQLLHELAVCQGRLARRPGRPLGGQLRDRPIAHRALPELVDADGRRRLVEVTQGLLPRLERAMALQHADEGLLQGAPAGGAGAEQAPAPRVDRGRVARVQLGYLGDIHTGSRVLNTSWRCRKRSSIKKFSTIERPVITGWPVHQPRRAFRGTPIGSGTDLPRPASTRNRWRPLLELPRAVTGYIQWKFTGSGSKCREPRRAPWQSRQKALCSRDDSYYREGGR